jgi:cytochrome b involved in lipid metabolism
MCFFLFFSDLYGKKRHADMKSHRKKRRFGAFFQRSRSFGFLLAGLAAVLLVFLVAGTSFIHAESDDYEEEGEYEDTGYRAPVTVQEELPPLLNYTAAEVSLHNTSSNCWISIYGYVLDMNSYTGTDKYTCGADNTALYQAMYGADLSRMGDYYIGNLIAEPASPENTSSLDNQTLSRNVPAANESDNASVNVSANVSAGGVGGTGIQAGLPGQVPPAEKLNIFVRFWHWLGFGTQN